MKSYIKKKCTVKLKTGEVHKAKIIGMLNRNQIEVHIEKRGSMIVDSRCVKNNS
jgi:hypothetical protein